MRSTATLPIFYFYFCLSILKTIQSKSYLERKIEMLQVKHFQKKIKLWAKHAPMNQLHRYYLIEAEIHRVENSILKAMEFYDLAIQHSRENEYINDTALANELAGNFFYYSGRKKISEIYLKSSLYFYNLWGATVKVDQMMKDYPDILGQKDDRSMKALNSFTFHGNNQSFDLSSFLKATETISKEIQFDKLLSSLNQIIIENVGAERGLILLNNNDRLFVECESSITKSETLILKSMPFEGSQLPRSIINYILRSKENILINDALTDDRFYRDPYLLENKIKSILCYTILKQDKVFGIFYLENNQSTYAFQSVSEDFLKAISSQAIITIENARLYANLESKVQDRTQELDYSLKQQFILNQDLVKTTNNLNFSLNTLKKDLGLAKKIQESILPKNLESIESLDIATYYSPMEIVGGDFYDIERISPTKVRIFLADATGHGIQGALVTMAIKSEYENLKTLLSEPHEILEFLNSEFQKKFQSVNVFFTGIVIDIDLNKDKIKYASAGHPAQLIVSETKTEKLTNSGRMIGIKENSGYKQFELDFPKNSKLFIFTDGIYEQINNLRDEFGEDRLFKFLEMNYKLPSNKIIEILINEVNFFMNGSKIEDDITFLAIGNIEADQKIDSVNWDTILKSGPFVS
jgi:serine phosphatase RsbU (regulator of sigma subunit)